LTILKETKNFEIFEIVFSAKDLFNVKRSSKKSTNPFKAKPKNASKARFEILFANIEYALISPKTLAPVTTIW